jgi:hypothetical protein
MTSRHKLIMEVPVEKQTFEEEAGTIEDDDNPDDDDPDDDDPALKIRRGLRSAPRSSSSRSRSTQRTWFQTGRGCPDEGSVYCWTLGPASVVGISSRTQPPIDPQRVACRDMAAMEVVQAWATPTHSGRSASVTGQLQRESIVLKIV